MRSKRLGRLMVASLTLAMLIVLAPRAYASPAGAGVPNDNRGPSGASPTTGAQAVSPDPTWLAAKNAFRVRSGVLRNQPKGTASHPYILSPSQAPAISPPSADELDINNPVPGVWESSTGANANYGPGTAHTDDFSNPYADLDFYGMCGPGAADNALWYWPLPNNLLSPVAATDYGPTHASTPSPAVTTTWSSERLRGYMSHLAWQIQWPGWPNAGMLDQTSFKTQGTTLYGMQGALNWEASGENPSTWFDYFYVIVWDNHSDQATFHSQVVSDIFNSNVPVIAEVNADMLDNWQVLGGMNRHFITIIGYNDTNGTYTYTDTCAHSTGCNGTGNGSDGGTHTVAQKEIWDAIANILPTPFPNDPSQGDGGYIW